MRRYFMILGILAALCTAAIASAAVSPVNRFDGAYHVNAPTLKTTLNVDCPAANNQPAVHIKTPFPVKAFNTRVSNGMYGGHRIMPGVGATTGRISVTLHTSVSGGSATVTSTVTFNTTFHTIWITAHVLGRFNTCAMTGGYFQSGHRTGP